MSAVTTPGLHSKNPLSLQDGAVSSTVLPADPPLLNFDEAVRLCQNKQWEDLSKNKDKLNKITDITGRSLLAYAVVMNLAEWVEHLILAKIGLHEKDKEGNNAFHLAAINGAVHLFHYLVEFLDINDTNSANDTPLHAAIKAGKDQSVAALINYRVDLHRSTSLENILLAPLGLAVALGKIKCIDILIQKGRCSLQQKIPSIGNLLHLAVRFKQPRVIRHLLAHYPEMKELLDATNDQGVTPLAYAAGLGKIQSLRLLASKGASIDKSDSRGRSPIHHAAYHKQYQAIQALAYLGAVLNKEDSDHQKPLDIVVKEKDRDQNALTTCNFLQNCLKQGKKFSLLPTSSSYPKNLVFRGGGVKGTTFAGVFQAFEERGLLRHVRRVAGSSAGAITATLIAVDYSREEIEEILFKKNFTDFVDHALTKKKLSKAIQDNFGSLGKVLGSLLSLYRTIVDPTQLLAKLWQTTGICDGEELRKWGEERIYKKVELVTGKKIDFLTFGEFNELIQQGYPFKHLYMYGTKLGDEPAIVTFSSESPECRDVIISDALRISASFPGVFAPHQVHIKHQGERIKCPARGTFTDGGVLYNLPLETFDQKRFQKEMTGPEGFLTKFNAETLGFNLISSDKKKAIKQEVETIGDLVTGLITAYLESETIRRDLIPGNASRIVDIDVGDVKTTDFGLSDEKKRALVVSGYKAASQFLQAVPSTVEFKGLNLKYPLDPQDLHRHLCTALQENKPLNVQSILALGLDIDQLVDAQGNGAVHFFVEKENISALNFVDEEGASLDLKNRKGQTPFHQALSQGKLASLQWLYVKNPDYLRNNGKTAMELASQGGHVLVMDWLHKQDSSWLQPSCLDLAIEARQPDAIKWILDQQQTQELNLTRKGLGDEKIQGLAKALENNSSVKNLDLRRNNLTSQIGRALGSLFRVNQHLKVLILEKNTLGDDGAQAIGEGLALNKIVLHLNLIGNQIGDKGGLAIVQTLPSSIQELNLAANELTDITVEKLSEFLKGNRTLIKLSLWGNKITGKGAQLLLEALKNNPSFKELTLHGNEIKDNEKQILQEQKVNFQATF